MEVSLTYPVGVQMDATRKYRSQHHQVDEKKASMSSSKYVSLSPGEVFKSRHYPTPNRESVSKYLDPD